MVDGGSTGSYIKSSLLPLQSRRVAVGDLNAKRLSCRMSLPPPIWLAFVLHLTSVNVCQSSVSRFFYMCAPLDHTIDECMRELFAVTMAIYFTLFGNAVGNISYIT